MYDLIIVGCGPAGMAAAVAAGRKNLMTLVIAKEVWEPENLKSQPVCFSFTDLIKAFTRAAQEKKIEIKRTEVINIEKNIVSFSVQEKNGFINYGKNILLATGAAPLIYDTLTAKTPEGKIKVDANLTTSVPGILAAGDVTREKLLGEEVAMGEGIKAVEANF